MLDINEYRHDEPSENDADRQCERSRPVPEIQPTREETETGQHFHQHVTHRNRRFAIRAFPSQVNPGDQRDVQEPRNAIPTIWAMGPRPDYAQVQRHPVNANVQKTPHHAPEHEKHNRPEVKRNSAPELRIEYVGKYIAQAALAGFKFASG